MRLWIWLALAVTVVLGSAALTPASAIPVAPAAIADTAAGQADVMPVRWYHYRRHYVYRYHWRRHYVHRYYWRHRYWHRRYW